MNCFLLLRPQANKTKRDARPVWYWLLALLTVLASATGSLAQTVTIGSVAIPAASPATSDYFYGPIYQPAGGAPNYSRYAHLYTAAELGIPSGSTITQLDWLKADAGTITGNDNSLQVLLSNSTATTLASNDWGTLTTSATNVYGSSTFNVTGTAGTYLTVPTAGFVYTGGSLLVLTDWAKGSTVSGYINFVTNPAVGMGIGQRGNRFLTNSTMLVASPYGDRRPTLRITYVPNVACTAPPTAGTAVATASSTCAGSVVSLTLSGATLGTGLTYQWQSSTTGAAGSYIAITGATNSSYITPTLTQTRYYRALVTCSGQTATSSAAQVTVQAPTYATVPYAQGFESTWLSRCGTREVPDTNWLNTPITSDNSWRRDDDSTSANWTQPGVGVYSPAGSNAGGVSSLHSARFHNSSPLGGVGTFDLYVNLGSGVGTPTLKFDYYNPDSNTMQVLLSTDGGVTFPTTLQTVAGNASWTNYLIYLPSTVTATSVIRFQAASNYGSFDNGIDNVSVSYVQCAPPTNIAATVSSAGATASASLTFTPVIGAASYSLSLSPTVTGAPTTAGSSPVSLTGLAYGTTYTVTLTTTCATSTSQASTYSFTTPCAPPTYTTLPYTQGFETAWLSRCDTNDVPDTHWRNTPVTGDGSWRRDDDVMSANWSLPYGGSYSPAGSMSSHSARFHSSGAVPGTTGSFDLYANLSATGTKVLTFDYVNNSAISSKLDVLLSTDGGATFAATPLLTLARDSVFTQQIINLTATSATTVIRFQATSDYGFDDIGLDNVRLRMLSAVDPAPISLATPLANQDCYSTAETVAVVITNAGLALNFANNPATVKAIVTLPSGSTQTLTATVNTGTLAAGATQTVQLAPTLNMNQVGTYSFMLTATAPGDTNPANDTLKPAVVRTLFAPLIGLLSPASTTICTGNTTVLALTGYAGGSVVLQRSSDNVTFTDITGFNGTTYTTPALTATTYYRVQVRCGANIATSNLSTVTVNNPVVTATNTPVGICVGNTATLTATASAGSTVRFFSVPTGGTALGTTTTGSYTTPTLTASATYYAEASSPTREAVGLLRPSTTTGFLSSDYGVVFSTTSPITLQSATVYPVGTGTLTFALVNSAGIELAATPALSVAGSGFATPVSVNLGLYVPAAGTDYRLVLKAYTGLTDLLLESSMPYGTAYPFTAHSGLLTLTSGYFSGSTSTSVYSYFYNLIISTSCVSVRTAIQVNVVSPPVTPTVTTTGNSATGITLTSSALTGNQWYLNGVAIMGATSQSYLINSGARNGSYTVVTSSGGCASAPSAAVAVTVTATTAGRSLALTVHPNPTLDGLVTLELGGATSPTELTVLDALGRVILTRQLPSNASRYELDLGKATSGVYLLRLRNDNGVATRRLTRE